MNGKVIGGTTNKRPESERVAGQTYGDRNHNKLCWYNAYLGSWVDPLGNTPAPKRSSIPSSGTYVVGDIIWNLTPTSGGYIGWVCIEEGTPGKWKGFGSISS